MYREVGEPRVNQPRPKPESQSPIINPLIPAATANEVVPSVKPIIDEAAVRAKLEEARAELKIKGEIIYPLPAMDFSEYVFDAEHTQGDKHPHDVTEEEARKFIAEAYFVIVRYKGNSYNYYGKEGATFVRLDLKTLRTAFKANEYDDNIQKLLEAYENAK